VIAILVGLVPQNVFRRVRRALLPISAGVLATAVLATASALAQAPPVGATAEVRDAAGRLVATGELRDGRGEVLIALSFATPAGLTGTHAVHIQEVGRCGPPDFQRAGADFNPFNKQHGRQNPDGPHLGDLPNVNLANGLTSFNTSAPGATLGPGTGSLLGGNGTALVIYSGEDDQRTDPEGSSGTRIACGVIVVAAPGAVPKPVGAQPGVASPIASTIRVPAAAAVPKPVVSPIPVVAAASPIVIVAAPTLAPPATGNATQTGGRSLESGPALIIAVLGMGLICAGYLLRRRSQLGR